MLAEVISIGDEITSGQRLDTNSQWLSSRLAELGARVMYHTTVADDLAANVQVFRAAFERADVVVATGGLGPTADDLTREAIAAAANRPLELDDEALRHIEQLFSRRQRPMPERNRLQAMFPQGSRVIFNPQGTAPGIDLEVARPGWSSCRIFALPGVPAEMFRMWDDAVAPAIRALFPTPQMICYRRIKCFGVGESDLEQMLPDLIRRGRDPQVGITVSGATITLRIAAEGESESECLEKMEPTIATIRECLGTLVFGEEDDELQDAIMRILSQQGKTLATAEWGTGGVISDWLTTAQSTAKQSTIEPIADSAIFLGGFSVPSAAARAKLLSQSSRLATRDLMENTADPSAVVADLADSARSILGADYALAVGELPRYDPKAAGPPPQFHYAIATPSGIRARSSPYAGPDDVIRPRACKQALNLLRLELLHAI